MTALQFGIPDFEPYPGLSTLVLANRQLRPDADPGAGSVFDDSRWHLSPAIFENHYTTMSLGFEGVPECFTLAAKHYLWAELNLEIPAVLKRVKVARLAVYTMTMTLRRVRAFLIWLQARGIDELDLVTPEHYDSYLADLLASTHSYDERSELLQVVRRLWAFRELLPDVARLPGPMPWDGQDTRALLGRSPRSRELENRTPRIGEATMEPLLCWAVRFIEDFSADIIGAIDEWRSLRPHRDDTGRSEQHPHRRSRTVGGGMLADITQLIDELRESCGELPGRVTDSGNREIDFRHLERLMDSANQGLNTSPHRDLFAASGLPIADGAYLRHHVTGLLDGRPWLRRIRYGDAYQLSRLLLTASFVVISYLSGARPGEVLNLRRGCITYDAENTLWLMRGRKWKGALDSTGAKIPEGELREEPWVVAEVVVAAVRAMEQAHDHDLLFPSAIISRSRTRQGRARSGTEINDDIAELIGWVNDYCQKQGRRDRIPDDPAGPVLASRFRRTLAWFICRRPRGLVACALQYAHMHVQLTLGYSGTYASGFPDEMAFEQWLTRLEDLEEHERRLQTGERVSGPAAHAYCARVSGGTDRFAGRVIRSARQARAVLANPALQIYPGKGMTCVFDASKALCQMRGADTTDDRRTPDLDDCRPNCRNIARTDRDMTAILHQAEDLRELVDDPLCPPIRHERHRRQLSRLEEFIDEHRRARSTDRKDPS